MHSLVLITLWSLTFSTPWLFYACLLMILAVQGAAKDFSTFQPPSFKPIIPAGTSIQQRLDVSSLPLKEVENWNFCTFWCAFLNIFFQYDSTLNHKEATSYHNYLCSFPKHLCSKEFRLFGVASHPNRYLSVGLKLGSISRTPWDVFLKLCLQNIQNPNTPKFDHRWS